MTVLNTESNSASYLRVKYNQERKTITCTFLGALKSTNTKVCHIAYGPCGPQANVHSDKAENSTTARSPNTATIQLPLDILGYCFTATIRGNSIFSVQLIDGIIVGE